MPQVDALRAYYLEQAARVRVAAAETTIKEFRDELFKIAGAFERLAERATHLPSDPV
jgi:hypothetical protein